MNDKSKGINKVLLVISIIFGLLICFIITMFIIVKLDDRKYQKEREKAFEEISYDIPDQFGGDFEYFFYSYSDDSMYCYLSIDDSEKYDESINEWFASWVSVDLDEEITKRTKATIDGKEFPFVEIVSGNKVEHYYGIESKNYFFLITYSITDYLKGDRENTNHLCYTAEDELLSSIKINK